jgi:hypothetical protein
MRRTGMLALALLLLQADARDAFAYLKFGVTVGGRTVTLKWNTAPVPSIRTHSSWP